MLLILPTVLVIFGFIFFPVAYSIYLSFTDSHALYPDYAYVGIENYPRLLAEPEFWSSAWNGAVWAVSTTLLQLVLGLGVALLLNESFRGRGLVRGIALFPYIVPTIVTILVWKWMLNATYGTVNYFLISLGLVRDPVVFLSPKWIMLSLIVVGIWQFFPFVVISVLARLQTIDLQLYEAAGLLGIAAITNLVFRRRAWDGQVFLLYLVLYAGLRFVTETFRGDVDRGGFFGDALSFSQGMSGVFAVFGLAVFLWVARKQAAKRAVGLQIRGQTPESPG